MLGEHDKIQQDAMVLGVKIHQEQSFKIWKCHVEILSLLRYAMGQWRASATGIIGWDLVAVKLIADTLNIPWSAQLLRQLAGIERYLLQHRAGGSDGSIS